MALIACVALLALVFSPPVERYCAGHRVGCGLMTGFVSTSLIVLIGYFFLFSWTLRRARRSYVDTARGNPERFFVVPPRLRADPVGRESVTDAVAQEVAFSRSGIPVVVVGEAGAGKTTFLLGLVRRLAEMGSVPVLVPLRGATAPVDLRDLAAKEFERRIDPVVRSPGDAERVWRRLLAEGSVVVLADGLDEVSPGSTRQERDYVIRFALASARNDRLSTVLTSRPEAVPSGVPISAFALADLEDDDALKYLRDSVHLRSGEDTERLHEIVSAGRVTHTPYYLNIISSLYRAERLRPVAASSRDALLVGLLDDWTDLVEDDTFREDVELEAGRRRTIVDDLATVAYAMTLDSAPDCTLSRVRAILEDEASGVSSKPADLSLVVEGAARLDLIRAGSTKDDTTIRFNHGISQAYMTSRYLRREPDAWRRLVDRTTSTEMRDALLMWCAGSDDGQAQDVCEALLKRAGALHDDRALALLVSAAEIASCAGMASFDGLAEGVVSSAWLDASPRAKVAAVGRLNRRTDAWSYGRLYEATRDRSYRVRWSAALAIVGGGASASNALQPAFHELLDYAESREPRSWGKPETHDLSVLGWILPALSASVTEDEGTDVDAALERLVALAERHLPLGTDASLAQGFKLAAALNPQAAILSAAPRLIDHFDFWYARVILLQAIGAACAGGSEGQTGALALMSGKRDENGEHPFVREAASLCLKAIRSPAGWRQYVWEDESSVIARSGAGLTQETTALLADLVVLLNLTEQGNEEKRIERKERTYGERVLPYCLSASKDRRELFEGCHESCTFGLCPYPSTGEQALARAEFSQAFCRRQIDSLTGLSRIQALRPSRRAWWWSDSTRASLAGFWIEMERRAG